MQLLVDTHLLLWWLADSPSLPAEARTLIADAENTVFVSAVSMWEIWLKESLGKLRLPRGFEDRLAAGPFARLPLTGAQARRVAALPWHHRDPSDRMRVAQVQQENLILLTADDPVAAYGGRVRLVRQAAPAQTGAGAAERFAVTFVLRVVRYRGRGQANHGLLHQLRKRTE
ncbi:MAG: type II toxin-antitoxin system VapC family toxin [Bryobacterales bacterium]|nr:type II toxin-antitoxin system VapC family toxin [Bryobacterales bacterium]